MEPVVSESPFEEMDGPVLLLAGPGTGKTYQLAKRIQSLVDVHGVDPKEITVITFTKEAAQGMRNKINEQGKAEYIEPSKRPRNIVTMHSLGHRIIEENAQKIGLQPDITVVSSYSLKSTLMRDAAFLAGCSEEVAREALKDKETANTSPSDNSTKVLEQYSKILKACNAIDFDDQISIASDILEAHDDVLTKYKASSKHLLVDEYQDINSDQHRFITLLTSGQTKGLFAVGDDDQSIYSFRGGDPSFIRNFANNYSDAKVLQLQVSRRCLKNILDCAVALVKTYDADRTLKAEPIYTNEDDGLVKTWNCPSQGGEASCIANAIYAKKANGEAEDFFVLVPNRNYVLPVTQALKGMGLEYSVGTADASNEEWEKLLIVRGWLANPTNTYTRQIIEFIVNCGAVRTPSHRVRKEEHKQTRASHCQQIADLWLPVIAGEKTLIESLRDSSTSSEMLAEVIVLMNKIKESYDTDSISTFLDALRTSTHLFENIKDFYLCLQRLEDKQESGSNKSPIRILTYQSSKGLEADCVFVIGLEEGTIPTDLSDTTRTAEEARLLFVAMTRAKRQLHLMHCRTRTGASTYRSQSRQLKPSAFITSLPSKQVSPAYIQAKGSK